MDRERHARGLSIRREVLGADHVDRAVEGADELTADFQELVTEYCWGAVWGREGLSRRARSLVTLAMLAALNRPSELELHVKGALRNGCSRAEIREVLLQVAVYCGVPAGVDAFRAARSALAGADADAATEGTPSGETRPLDRATVERLAAYAGLALAVEDVDAHVERLREFAAWMDEWADERLPFRFEDGTFSYTPLLAQFRPEWRRPDAPGENRPADGSDEG
ncbi:MAG TPA: 4-carboxymuconolactone decarboxylase [Gaiellaceae bacterium]|nr:4-carboxymuconolactone decarboxylase [Gaiellaceae bacterium]